MWHYQDKEFTTEMAQSMIDDGYLGFVYEITDTFNGKKYIGKKLLVTQKVLPPLKGQKRKRKSIIQSDWQKYYGSSETVKENVRIRKADFRRDILEFCKAKGELSYIEAKYHFDREVLLKEEYYNAFIGCRINAKHIKNLWKK
jgi:hypothetical protein